jgi:hypothetical protein
MAVALRYKRLYLCDSGGDGKMKFDLNNLNIAVGCLIVLVVALGMAGSQASFAQSASGLVLPTDNSAGQGLAEGQALQVPMSFIENMGQSPGNVKFNVQAADHTISFTPDKIQLMMTQNMNNTMVSSLVTMSFEGANSSPTITGLDELSGDANFLVGDNSSDWYVNVPTFGAIEYKQLYQGIDLTYSGTQGLLKREFVISPGVNPDQIIIDYSGAGSLNISSDGSLQIRTSLGVLVDQAPIAYQLINNERIPVQVGYQLLGGDRISFSLGDYDPAYQLIIDPTLLFSSAFGGSSNDQAYAVASDNLGNAYITGYTASTNYPTVNPYQSNLSSGYDNVFVMKINVSTGTIVYSTYLGGNASDTGSGIAVDSSGNVYVTGKTTSSNFPTTSSAYQSVLNGQANAFVTKISSSGNGLVYSTYLGGSGNDMGQGIAVDSAGNAYVTGLTTSTNFPTMSPVQASQLGQVSAFVSKFNSAGSLVYSTYLGGDSYGAAQAFTEGSGIAVDTAGDAYITGTSTTIDYPTTQGAFQYQPVLGVSGGFVTELNSAGSMVYSTWLSGLGYDQPNSIAIDSAGNAYVTGYTTSNNFPVQNAYQPNLIGSQDAFVTKVNAGGSSIGYSTYLGNGSSGNGITIDSTGNVYVTGTTPGNFPLVNATQSSYGGGLEDGFVSELSPAGSLTYSTYLGGCGNDTPLGIAIDNSTGNVYVAGYTDNGTSFPSVNPLQSTIGGTDAFITVISPQTVLSPSVSNITANGMNVSYTLGGMSPQGNGVYARIFNSGGSVVRTVWLGIEKSGTYNYTWDGMADYGILIPYWYDQGNYVGIPCPNGTYTIQIYASIYNQTSTGVLLKGWEEDFPMGAAFDSSGNLFITANDMGPVYERYNTNETMVTVANDDSSVDVALDPSNNVFYTDQYNVTEVYSNGTMRMLDENVNNGTWYLTVDGNDNVFFTHEQPGSGTSEIYANGTIREILPIDATGVAVDSNDNLYIADGNNYTIYELYNNGTMRTVVSNMSLYPWDLSVDAHGNLFVAMGWNGTVEKIYPNGTQQIYLSTDVAYTPRVDYTDDMVVAGFTNGACTEAVYVPSTNTSSYTTMIKTS